MSILVQNNREQDWENLIFQQLCPPQSGSTKEKRMKNEQQRTLKCKIITRTYWRKWWIALP